MTYNILVCSSIVNESSALVWPATIDAVHVKSSSPIHVAFIDLAFLSE